MDTSYIIIMLSCFFFRSLERLHKSYINGIRLKNPEKINEYELDLLDLFLINDQNFGVKVIRLVISYY